MAGFTSQILRQQDALYSMTLNAGLASPECIYFWCVLALFKGFLRMDIGEEKIDLVI